MNPAARPEPSASAAELIWSACMSPEAKVPNMNRSPMLVVLFTLLAADLVRAADVEPPGAGRGAATVPVWNPHRPAAGNPPLTVRVLVLNYDPLVPAEGHRRLSEVFRWN